MEDKITQAQYDKAFDMVYQYEASIDRANQLFLDKLSDEAKEDFKELVAECQVEGEVTFVDYIRGQKQHKDCGVFKDVHVDQWCTNQEGDSFSGIIYARYEDKIISVPFKC